MFLGNEKFISKSVSDCCKVFINNVRYPRTFLNNFVAIIKILYCRYDLKVFFFRRWKSTLIPCQDFFMLTIYFYFEWWSFHSWSLERLFSDSTGLFSKTNLIAITSLFRETKVTQAYTSITNSWSLFLRYFLCDTVMEGVLVSKSPISEQIRHSWRGYLKDVEGT